MSKVTSYFGGCGHAALGENAAVGDRISRRMLIILI